MIPGLRAFYAIRTLERGDRRLVLGRPTFRMVTAILASPHGIHTAELEECFTLGEEDGGPLNPRGMIAVLASKYRKPLEHLGLVLVNGSWGRPWRILDAWSPAQRAEVLEHAAERARVSAQHAKRRTTLLERRSSQLAALASAERSRAARERISV